MAGLPQSQVQVAEEHPLPLFVGDVKSFLQRYSSSLLVSKFNSIYQWDVETPHRHFLAWLALYVLFVAWKAQEPVSGGGQTSGSSSSSEEEEDDLLDLSALPFPFLVEGGGD